MAGEHNKTLLEVERMKLGALKQQGVEKWIQDRTQAGSPPTGAEIQAYTQLMNSVREFSGNDRLGAGPAPPMPAGEKMGFGGMGPPAPVASPLGIQTPAEKMSASARLMASAPTPEELAPLKQQLQEKGVNPAALAQLLAGKDRLLKGGMPAVAKEVLARGNTPREKIMEQIQKQLVTDAMESQGTSAGSRIPDEGMAVGNFKIVPQLAKRGWNSPPGAMYTTGYNISGPGGYSAVVPNGTRFLGENWGGPGDITPTWFESTRKQRGRRPARRRLCSKPCWERSEATHRHRHHRRRAVWLRLHRPPCPSQLPRAGGAWPAPSVEPG